MHMRQTRKDRNRHKNARYTHQYKQEARKTQTQKSGWDEEDDDRNVGKRNVKMRTEYR